MSIGALSEDQLGRIEHDFCRARRRSDYWRNAQEQAILSAHGAIGRLAKLMTDCRNREVGTNDLTQAKLGRLLQIQPQRIGEFFNGDPINRMEWTKIGYRVIRTILCGTEDFNQLQKGQRDLAARVLNFFFPRGYNEAQGARVDSTDDMVLHPDHPGLPQPWYFSKVLHNSEERTPASLMEVEAELRALEYAARVLKVSSRVVRVSGLGRFRQIDDSLERPTVNGEISLKCAEAGIPLVFVVPDCCEADVPSVRSALAFKRVAEARYPDGGGVTVLRIPLTECRRTDTGVRFSFEYFCRDLRWQLFDRSDGETCLIVSRDSSVLSPSSFAPREFETKRLMEWITLFVDPLMKEDAEGVSPLNTSVVS